MATPAIVWVGKKFPCREALNVIMHELSFHVDLTKGKIARKEIAITFNPRTGYYVVYETTVNRDIHGTALENGFVAETGATN
jgi:hypothetical protein